MVNHISSRTNRRMEKRQAIWMLMLVLLVSLISFGLGIMVGKRGTPPIAHKENPPLVTRLPAIPDPVTESQVEAVSPPEKESKPELTFYETLAKTRKPPLGTGINLPPPTEKETRKPASPSVMKEAVTTPPPAATPMTVPALATDSPPQSGGYVVQTGSFKKQEAAERLRNQLIAKGFDAFVRQADMGEKGTWFRVLAGPVMTKNEAEGIAADLKKKARLSGFVRKL